MPTRTHGSRTISGSRPRSTQSAGRAPAHRREDSVIAAIGGLSLVGILVVVLLVVAIMYFVRRA